MLDLWGLADQEARERRLAGGDWVGGLVARRHVALAVLSTRWFGQKLPSTWVRVGALVADVIVTNNSHAVDVYVTDPVGDPESVTAACAALRSFADDAAQGTRVELAGPCAA